MSLPERLRDVVVSYFLDGEASSSIAARLGVTESRVSQMRSEAWPCCEPLWPAVYDDEQRPGRCGRDLGFVSRQVARRSVFASTGSA